MSVQRLPNDGVFELPQEKYSCPISNKQLITPDVENRIKNPVVLFDETNLQVYDKASIIRGIVEETFDKRSLLDSEKIEALKGKVSAATSEEDINGINLSDERLCFPNLIELHEKEDTLSLFNLDEVSNDDEIPGSLAVTTCCNDTKNQPVLRFYNKDYLVKWLQEQVNCVMCKNTLSTKNFDMQLGNNSQLLRDIAADRQIHVSNELSLALRDIMSFLRTLIFGFAVPDENTRAINTLARYFLLYLSVDGAENLIGFVKAMLNTTLNAEQIKQILLISTSIASLLSFISCFRLIARSASIKEAIIKTAKVVAAGMVVGLSGGIIYAYYPENNPYADNIKKAIYAVGLVHSCVNGSMKVYAQGVKSVAKSVGRAIGGFFSRTIARVA
jgi:hypothetical protein